MAINPMLEGSGLNVKMLEYMAYSLPIVTTNVGARGIEAVENQHFRLAELDRFAEALQQLADNPEEAARLGANGLALVQERYSNAAAARQMVTLLDTWRSAHKVI
jgi:glycosyltransferase involved in cell wall biosynthesis